MKSKILFILALLCVIVFIYCGYGLSNEKTNKSTSKTIKSKKEVTNIPAAITITNDSIIVTSAFSSIINGNVDTMVSSKDGELEALMQKISSDPSYGLVFNYDAYCILLYNREFPDEFYDYLENLSYVNTLQNLKIIKQILVLLNAGK